jgi:hypothetical protein
MATIDPDDCPHDNVVAHKTHDDGSIDGKCQDCGDEGFPIVDKSYEEFMDGEENGAQKRLQTLISDLKTEPHLARLVRMALAEAGP